MDEDFKEFLLLWLLFPLLLVAVILLISAIITSAIALLFEMPLIAIIMIMLSIGGLIILITRII